MGDRRKRKSLWDEDGEAGNFSRMNEHRSWSGKEAHYSHHDSRRYHEFPASRGYSATKSRESTGQTYWEPMEESGSLMNDNPLQKEIGGESRYFQNMSPGFDGTDPHKYDHSRESVGGYSHRSRSRSRTRGRSSSRSLSRGRTRDRSRSRSRSRGKGGASGRLRSPSPAGKAWHSWNDQRTLPSKASDVSRDFSAGESRKGNDSGDSFRGGNERSQSRSSHTVPCREFPLGKCRFGDSCRFSHHIVSEENFGKGSGRGPSEMDNRHLSYKDTRPFCKFFAVGNCQRSNCRFSHEDPKIGGRDGRNAGVSNDWRNDSQLVHGLKNENKITEIPEWTPEPFGGVAGNGESTGASVPMAGDVIANKVGNSALDFQLRRHDNRVGEVHNSIREHASAITPSLLLHPEDPVIAERASVGYQSGATNLMDYKSAAHTSLFPVQKPDLEVERVLYHNSSILNESDGIQGVYRPNTSNGFGANLLEARGPHLNLPSQIQSNENSVHGAGSTPTKAPQTHLIHNLSSAQLTNATASIPYKETDLVAKLPVLSRWSNENELPHRNAVTGSSVMLGISSSINSTDAPSNIETTAVENGSGENKHDYTLDLKLGLLPNAASQPDIAIYLGNSKVEQEIEPTKSDAITAEEVPQTKQAEAHDGAGEDESIPSKDEKGVRLFKNCLIEFVKDILKPIWKEGKMSRDAHKNIVKKVIDKVTSTVQTDHIPKTQDKIDQYLKYSKSKITKLVQAYVDRSLKKDS